MKHLTCLRPKQTRSSALMFLMVVALVIFAALAPQSGRADGTPYPGEVLADSVGPGTLAQVFFTNAPAPPPTNNTVNTNTVIVTNNVTVTNDVPITNPGTIVIGSTASYIVLTPTTNATLELIASTTGSNGIDMLVFSSQNIFTFVGGDSCHTTNATNTVMVKFEAVSNLIYEIEVVGAGVVNFKYGLGVAPAVTTVQANTAVPQGCSVTLNGGASAIPSPAFQWQFKDVDIPGATKSTLTLSNAAASMIGNYRLRSTNDFGVAFSPEASVNVVPVNIGSPNLITNNSFHFNGTGLARQTYIIESSSDFRTWQSAFVVGAAGNGSFSFTQTVDTNLVARFFRAKPQCN